MKSWKSCERGVAELLGRRRVPVSGRGRGAVPDGEHDRLSIEVKSRGRVPAWLEEAVSQAEAAATDGRTPVAVVHRSGQSYGDALVVLRLRDFGGLVESRQTSHEKGNI